MAFLSDRAIDGSDGQGARGQWRTEDAYNSSADDNDGANRRRDPKSSQPKGTMAAIGKNEDFSTSPFFDSSSDRPTPCLHTTMGMPHIKHNRGRSLCAAVRM